VSVKIRLKRLGKVRVPQYRIVVVDSRKKRDGKVIEEIGKYHPKEDPSYISVVSDRAQYWLGVGAQPSDAVAKLLKITGDWQTHKGLKGTEGTLKVAEPKRDKLDIFNEALKDAHGDSSGEALTEKGTAKKAAAKKPAPKKDAEKAADKPAEDEAPAEAPAEAAVVETPEPREVPEAETPEGAAELAETAEAAEVDAETKAEKSGDDS
jgi:small subunit ribosomal protein S16